MVVKVDGVWIADESRCESVARLVAIDCMEALGMDSANDFRTRDKIIQAISSRLNGYLDQVASEDVYRRALESMAAQFVHPKMTAKELADIQLRGESNAD